MPVPPKVLRRQLFDFRPISTAYFEGKTVCTTSGNPGLRLGDSEMIIGCRDLEKGRLAAQQIQKSTFVTGALDAWQLDMASYASLSGFTSRVKTELFRLNVLLVKSGIGTTTWNAFENSKSAIVVYVVFNGVACMPAASKLQETAVRYVVQTDVEVTGSRMYELAPFKECKGP